MSREQGLQGPTVLFQILFSYGRTGSPCSPCSRRKKRAGEVNEPPTGNRQIRCAQLMTTGTRALWHRRSDEPPRAGWPLQAEVLRGSCRVDPERASGSRPIVSVGRRGAWPKGPGPKRHGPCLLAALAWAGRESLSRAAPGRHGTRARSAQAWRSARGPSIRPRQQVGRARGNVARNAGPWGQAEPADGGAGYPRGPPLIHFGSRRLESA